MSPPSWLEGPNCANRCNNDISNQATTRLWIKGHLFFCMGHHYSYELYGNYIIRSKKKHLISKKKNKELTFGI